MWLGPSGNGPLRSPAEATVPCECLPFSPGLPSSSSCGMAPNLLWSPTCPPPAPCRVSSCTSPVEPFLLLSWVTLISARSDLAGFLFLGSRFSRRGECTLCGEPRTPQVVSVEPVSPTSDQFSILTCFCQVAILFFPTD